MNVWQIFTTGLLLLSACAASEQCTNSENGAAKAGDSCGCGATSRKTSTASADSIKTSSMEVENNEESPSYKYGEEANANQGLPRTNQMVHIPGGKFVMGTNDPVFTADGEQPARWVEIDGFYMDVYEVSNAEFQLFVLANDYVTEVCG
ncbi:Sulfatase-modifying factor 1 [Portunus trituberculatus]|uniref:Sulfatase-modifying factor 1 n=1 Tax=Portunus trituberculatus TaxID=210409 RepID=A0A5B7IFZ8_PORTR|nr:Sulfatase-modifying factor 1 [Portunus trituberculatus]